MAGKWLILTPRKTWVPEKVGALTPLRVKSGQCNGTPKKRGLKVVIFIATFTILLKLKRNQFFSMELQSGWLKLAEFSVKLLYLEAGWNPSDAKEQIRKKILISQLDFSNLKFGKKVNISNDWILILAENKKGRNMQIFQIVTECRRIGTNFVFQRFRYERSKAIASF